MVIHNIVSSFKKRRRVRDYYSWYNKTKRNNTREGQESGLDKTKTNQDQDKNQDQDQGKAKQNKARQDRTKARQDKKRQQDILLQVRSVNPLPLLCPPSHPFLSMCRRITRESPGNNKTSTAITRQSQDKTGQNNHTCKTKQDSDNYKTRQDHHKTRLD